MAHKLILENKLGQRMRTIALPEVGSATVHLIFRFDTNRLEVHQDLSLLEDAGVAFEKLHSFRPSQVEKGELSLEKISTLGHLRLVAIDESKRSATPVFELAAEDRTTLSAALKKSALYHAVAVVALVILSALTMKEKVEEPQLVTIDVPQPPKPIVERQQSVKVSETKIRPVEARIKKIADRTVIKPPPVRPVVQSRQRAVIRNQQRTVVRTEQMRNLRNVGALSALGGLKNGTRGFQGLDATSLKNVRSAGVGSGGGGVGAGRSGGMSGVLPGMGLIAGATGGGGRAESAGGYGTRGVGGGRAGYGQINLVGGTGGLSLPLDEEASVQGGLDRDQIAAVINRNKGQVVYCYEQGLQAFPELGGRVSIDFLINGSGRVARASVAHSSLRSSSAGRAAAAQVENCIVGRLRTWAFPRPVGGVNVDVLYPFELRRVAGRVAGGN
jgi:outer membrane biosynthesis protein TonB